MPITRELAASWAERYFIAWKTNDAETVASLFTEDAVYFYGPFREPARGREEIVRRWTENDAPPDFRSAFDVVAVEGDVAVVHWRVSWGGVAMDGVLVVTFDERGLCREHREWYARTESA